MYMNAVPVETRRRLSYRIWTLGTEFRSAERTVSTLHWLTICLALEYKCIYVICVCVCVEYHGDMYNMWYTHTHKYIIQYNLQPTCRGRNRSLRKFRWMPRSQSWSPGWRKSSGFGSLSHCLPQLTSSYMLCVWT